MYEIQKTHARYRVFNSRHHGIVDHFPLAGCCMQGDCSVNFQGLIRKYRLISPELTQAELEQLALQELTVKADVSRNFLKYDLERIKPKRKVPPLAERKRFQSSANTRQVVPVRDHTGQVFNSRAEMCEKWGISTTLFHCRLAKGWDLKRILTQVKRRRRTDDEIREDLIRKIDEKEKKNV